MKCKECTDYRAGRCQRYPAYGMAPDDECRFEKKEEAVVAEPEVEVLEEVEKLVAKPVVSKGAERRILATKPKVDAKLKERARTMAEAARKSRKSRK